MEERFFPYARQSISEEDIAAVAQALRGERITRGEKTREFEERLASYTGARFAVVFNNGTAALYAAFFAARAAPQDRFLTTPNSFIATTGAGMRLGLRPLFVDIERESGNMDIEKLAQALETPLSRGRLLIAPVHFRGLAIDMRALEHKLRTPDAVIIEDACHALGSFYPSGEKVGSCPYCQMTVFSFHPAKTITTGEGGAVTTNDKALYERLLRFRNNGIVRRKPLLEGNEAPSYYEVHDITGNFHMTELSAVLGLSQLSHIDRFIEKRRSLVARYRSHLGTHPLLLLSPPRYDAITAFHLMVVQINFSKLSITRSALIEELQAAGIGTDVHYVPIFCHPVVRAVLGDVSEAYPECMRYYEETLSLPLYYDLTDADVDHISKTLVGVINRTLK